MELPSMSSCILLSFFLQMIIIMQKLSLTSSLTRGGNETDRLSLVAFRNQITNDPLGALNSWNESLHFCEWSGVKCGRQHRRVVELDLRSCKLVGSLSPHIGNLSFLRILDLRNNSFSQHIPQELGHLFRLQVLSLGNNTFSGEIPVNISRCSNLQVLSLQKNNLTGKVPAALASLGKLQICSLAINNLTGEIPLSFGNLSSIERLAVGQNNLQGSIPNSIGRLKTLKIFSVVSNNLSGPIPLSVYNLSSLTLISLAINKLHGSLHPDLGLKLSSIEELVLFDNRFNGRIPATVSNASNLLVLDFGYNGFVGKVPTLAGLNLQYLGVDSNELGNSEEDDLGFLYTLTNSTDLEALGMNNNNFGGKVPEIVSNLSAKLRLLTMETNQIHGSIPTDVGNLIGLDTLSFGSNHLSGVIPTSIGKLKNLLGLSVAENKITGDIPSSLGNITSLLELYLSDNNLQGSIPASLGNCHNLLSLNLSLNNLSGSIPNEVIGVLSVPTNIDLSRNQFTGSLPAEVGKLENLGYLSVSYNMLSGEIPTSLGSCIGLEILYLDGNYFQGPIPESLSSLRAIKEFNISHNNLTGQIPRFLQELKLLERLDLSFNDLEGEVPIQGVFKNESAISVVGNEKLCGGIPKLNLSKCRSHKSTSLKHSTKLILIIVSVGGFLGVIFTMISALLCCQRRTKNKHASRASWESSIWRVAYEELFQATDGFSSSNLIGAGSFGSVYKGILVPDGIVIAVKVFHLLHRGAFKSFMTECAALVNMRHRNLVKVLTVCSSIDFQGNDFKALVYEFMANGSLEEWLHPIQLSEPRNLNLIQRLNIAMDVASALDYLHHHCQISVVHCDLKPSNVLLDGDMTAHVGDFGLARFLQEASHDQLPLDNTSSVGIKGTIGYAAPEYGMGSEVSTHGDVYSYGILLLEMFTGKRPTDDMFKDGLNLHKFAKAALISGVAQVFDPILLGEAEESTSGSRTTKRAGIDKISECLISIIKVGVSCSAELPTERMDISNVVVELHRIREILSGTRRGRQH